MHVIHLQLTGDLQAGRRAAQLRLKRDDAMDAKAARIDEAGNVRERAALQIDVQIQPLRRRRVPRSVHEEAPEVPRGAVGAGGRSAEAQLHRTIAVGLHVQIGCVEIEHRLEVAKLEVDAAGAHLDGGHGSRRAPSRNWKFHGPASVLTMLTVASPRLR